MTYIIISTLLFTSKLLLILKHVGLFSEIMI